MQLAPYRVPVWHCAEFVRVDFGLCKNNRSVGGYYGLEQLFCSFRVGVIGGIAPCIRHFGFLGGVGFEVAKQSSSALQGGELLVFSGSRPESVFDAFPVIPENPGQKKQDWIFMKSVEVQL